ncbi:MAG TPA: acyl carrier protein [Planctomycetota bacterium]|nr:acyl carrier protein [Planctomycetota bacterium]OQC19958.1 MAG: Acyl carrier protein [Planctomycetes bacterium ADurb.Bin069]NMD34406.1 acyl carrier protein [Planctomycetota bacterium]HNR99503.1 acyl carrier protein [Planctomycetota bacterium]HNU27378.1 acyl carrier protein [Planctomycetota bacterium]
MTKVEIESQVREIIVEKFQVAPEKVTVEAKLDADLGADSLDLVDLMMILEDKFSLEISDDQAEKIKTVGDVIAYILAQNKE